FRARAPLAILRCFGRPGLPQDHSISGSATPISEISFQYLHNFTPLLPLPHKSIMREAQPDASYLNKSYLNAPDDDGGSKVLLQLGIEEAAVVALAHRNADALVDAGEEAAAVLEADKP